MADAAGLNADVQSAGLDRAALDAAISRQGEAFRGAVSSGHDHLFAAAPLFISSDSLGQMRAVVAAVEEAAGPSSSDSALGVFYGYDFHLDERGAHLIEINSNAGGAFLNVLLAGSQRDAGSSDVSSNDGVPEQVFLEMFHNEWRRERGDAPLGFVAIVDEQPEAQYLYPEFLLAQQMFERAGVATCIADPAQLEVRADGLYHAGRHIDLIYNRLTDFELQRHPQLHAAMENRQVVLTPAPAHYRRYADKHRLAQFTDMEWLRTAGVSQAAIDTLLRHVPQTRMVHAEDAEHWWTARKGWFFKPAGGYGSKGAYRGDKLTKRVFDEIMRSDYVAQRLVQPGERIVPVEGGEPQSLKYDVRCYVYDGRIQFVAARLYQGQTTNFRTPGGGFAVVRVVE